ncbi:hypothetical protein IFM89_006585 [Coptis chinensis]|uniref:AT4G36440-like protein n=1 Tax=Coptis chinensis TaxID=261450 RepID=A0A835IMP9_9MAGN|nr:hypothetical protein IFM89_006585 [Coptis chinensis]
MQGYVDFGRFDTFHHFVTGTGHVSFVQGFYNGDLMNCEQSFDKLGRTAQVNIICGSCLNGACKGQLGCICNVAYDSTCRVFVELAVPCEKSGPRIFKGFTVGFHPRSWEVVYNGLTQLGYEALRHEFSFGTEQTRVSLYMTAISSLSTLVGKPMLKVSPDKGLEVKLSGTGESGSPPTTLSPTMLNVDWTCQKASDTPYEVAISIPVEGYEPVEFTLSKMCAYKQGRKDDATRGWATFGIFSCMVYFSVENGNPLVTSLGMWLQLPFFVLDQYSNCPCRFFVISTLLCCGGFIYKTRVEHQHGLDALPGMTILSACLEAVTGGGGGGGGYSRVEDVNNTSINQASWERQPVSAQGSQRTSDRKYGSI